MKFFKKSEFYCPCVKCSLSFEDMDEDMIKDLDHARGIAEVPFKITSSIRCAEHNASLTNSTPTSSHLSGVAVDIACGNSYNRFRIMYGLWNAGFTRLGLGKNFIHADKDPDKPKELIWVY